MCTALRAPPFLACVLRFPHSARPFEGMTCLCAGGSYCTRFLDFALSRSWLIRSSPTARDAVRTGADLTDSTSSSSLRVVAALETDPLRSRVSAYLAERLGRVCGCWVADASVASSLSFAGAAGGSWVGETDELDECSASEKRLRSLALVAVNVAAGTNSRRAAASREGESPPSERGRDALRPVRALPSWAEAAQSWSWAAVSASTWPPAR